ncbi:MAG: D-alanyl-D-alanine carboxypeptidase [Gammaproteobacteria bacterium]|nr:D-alanyl-D-alanine carboxypeptidase [Gammaproteobacteria bacterium]MCZ6585443.1 D-alanyl-D-alanine carboxypeptidase [Gammaproteobacteria bacterium]
MIRAWILAGLLLATSGFAADVPIPAPPQIGADSFQLIDFSSGRIIAEARADERVEPASLTKLMTAYAAFHALRQGQITLQDQAHVSEKAWRTDGSRMFIEVNTRVSVEDLLRGMIIQSGNDASVALAEHVAGSEEVFLGLMNRYAELLGMTGSSFMNTTGLPAEGHYVTARDVAILARAIISEFPEYYRWYSEREFTYNGIRQFNRNSLLWRDDSIDGVKTGYTDAAGYCLVASAERSGMRLISVVTGMASAEAREDASQALLDYGFRFYETHKLYSGGEEITTARVWKGTPPEASLGLTEDLYVTVPRGQYDALEAIMDLRSELMAPLSVGAQVGSVRITLDDVEISNMPLMALHEVPEASLWTRIKDEVTLWLQ